MLPTKQITIIESSDLDELVVKTYKRRYCFQQQNGCKDKSQEEFTVPAPVDEYPDRPVPEEVNHHTMGTTFAAWLAKDPTGPFKGNECSNDLWWARNFYPHPQTILNDLHKRELLPAGTYTINVRW